MRRSLAILALAATTLPAFAQPDNGRLVDCRLIVDGQSYIDGRCRFTPQGSDGSFQIMAGNGQYFAQVLITEPGKAAGYWNEDPYANHAHSNLGDLTRQDACWVNERASVCAW